MPWLLPLLSLGDVMMDPDPERGVGDVGKKDEQDEGDDGKARSAAQSSVSFPLRRRSCRLFFLSSSLGPD